MTLYLNCSNHSAVLNKMATRAIIRKSFKQLLLLNQCTDFEIISQKCSLANPLQNCSNGSALLNKMAAKAINRKKALKDFFCKNSQCLDFEIIIQECSLGD